MYPFATPTNASFGHDKKKSIVVPLIKPGNFLARSAKFGFIGDIHSTICRFFRTMSTKYLTKFSVLSSESGRSLAKFALKSATIRFISSFGNKPATSPVINNELMYSKNSSLTISVSVKIHVIPLPCWPAVL